MAAKRTARRKTAVKRSPAKRTAQKRLPTRKVQRKVETVTDSPKRAIKTLSARRNINKYIVWGIFIVLILALLYLGRSLLIAAVVGTRPITRWEVVRELEKQGGQQTLDSLVTKELILQEAARNNITITDSEVSTEIDTIKTSLEGQGTTLDAALALQGQTQESLEENIRIQKLLEKLLQNDIQVSEEDIQKYFAENKEFYGDDANYEDIKESIRQQLTKDKMQTAFSTWIEKLKSDTQIIYFVNY